MKRDRYPEMFVEAGLSEEDSLIPALARTDLRPELRKSIAYYLWMSNVRLEPEQIDCVVSGVLQPMLRDLAEHTAENDLLLGMTCIEASEFLRFLLKFVAPSIAAKGTIDQVVVQFGVVHPVLDSVVWLQPLETVLTRHEELSDEQNRQIGLGIARCVHKGTSRPAHSEFMRTVLKRLSSTVRRIVHEELARLRS